MSDERETEYIPEDQLTFKEMMRDWARETAFTPYHVTCARCKKIETISMDTGTTREFGTGWFVCEECEPS